LAFREAIRPAKPTPKAVQKTGFLALIFARLERDLVVEFVAVKAARRAVARHTAAATTTALALAVEHLQLAAEAVQDDFGRVFLGTVFVGPFAGRKLALDVDLRTLAQ